MVPEAICLWAKPPPLHDQPYCVCVSLRRVGNPCWKQEHLRIVGKYKKSLLNKMTWHVYSLSDKQQSHFRHSTPWDKSGWFSPLLLECVCLYACRSLSLSKPCHPSPGKRAATQRQIKQEVSERNISALWTGYFFSLSLFAFAWNHQPCNCDLYYKCSAVVSETLFLQVWFHL